MGTTTIRLSGKARKRMKLAQLYRGYRTAYKVKPEYFVPGTGNLDAKVLVVGEHIGRREVEEGEPFTGKSGQMLTKLLRRVDLRREDVWLTNLVKHQPEEGHIDLDKEIPAYLGLMRMEIAIINPSVVVTLGRFATSMYFQNPHMSSLAGAMHVKDGRVIVPLHSPSVAFFDHAQKEDMRQHIMAVGDALKGVRR